MPHNPFPCLWFNNQAKLAAEFYCSIFKNSKIVSENPMVVIFELNETKFMALNGGPQYKFSPANSYVITCYTQEEIDHYWEKLGTCTFRSNLTPPFRFKLTPLFRRM